MKIRTRILLASGFYRFGGTIFLLLLTYYVHPFFLVLAIVWLASSRRIIREWLLPLPVCHMRELSTEAAAAVPLAVHGRCMDG